MPRKMITGWSIIGALLTVILLLIVYAILVRIIFPVPSVPVKVPTPIMLVINLATPTSPIPANATPQAKPTATLDPAKYAGINIGQFVQITGTDGDGLRLRSGPGTENPPLFLGLDAEVFQVREGPKESNDLVWWFLVSPSDENRKGWAASKYLALLPPQ